MSAKNILLLSQYAPSKAHAGGLRVLDIYKLIREHRPGVRLHLACGRDVTVDGDISECLTLFDGIELLKPNFSFTDFENSSLGNRRFDLIDLQFHQAGRLAKSLRRKTDRILFTPMECVSRTYFELLRRKAKTGQLITPRDIHRFLRSLMEEWSLSRFADLTVCVSDADAAFLKWLVGDQQLDYLPTGLSTYEFEAQLDPGFTPSPIEAKGRRLVFAAYFGSDTNIAGLRWYMDMVHPTVLAACPDYELMVVGRGDLAKAAPNPPAGVTLVGAVDALAPLFERSRAGLVLALYGGGFRGKINQYALCGLPSISTHLGVSGLSYVADKDILIADEPQHFANACIRVLTNDALALELGNAARRRALESYSWERLWPDVERIYGLSEG